MWQEFMMHHAIAIEENGEQTLRIWSNFKSLFQSCMFWCFGQTCSISMFHQTRFDVFIKHVPSNMLHQTYSIKTLKHVERIHDAPCHCNRRKQWANPSHFTELEQVLFSVLALLDASIGLIGLWFQCHCHIPMIRHQLWPF